MGVAPQHFDLSLPPFALECGAPLPHLHLRAWWWGPAADHAALHALGATPAPSGDPQRALGDAAPPPPGPSAVVLPPAPTILLCHALTGDARAGGPGGWWEPLIGPGRALDPSKHRLLCFNQLGSCYGSFGPRDPSFPKRVDAPYAGGVPARGHTPLPDPLLPAPLTTWDQARALLRALDALGVQRLDAVIGGSVGGMLAMALAALAPDRVGAVIPVAALDHATAWVLGFNHIARQLIADALQRGDDATHALGLARQLAHLSYRASPGLTARQGRAPAVAGPWNPRAPYAMHTYLAHQGHKLAQRFDALSYLSMLDAMDHHDLGRAPPPPQADDTWRLPVEWTGLAQLPSLHAISVDSDMLFFAVEVEAMVHRYAAARPGRPSSLHQISSPHGHDGFLLSADQLTDALRATLRHLPSPESLP